MAEQVQDKSGRDTAQATRGRVERIVAGAEFPHLKRGFGGGVKVRPLKKKPR